MKKPFIGKNGERYWIYLPQGYRKERSDGRVSLGSIMVARNLKQANRLFNRLNAPYFERMIQCDLGRWALKAFVRSDLNHLTLDEIYEQYIQLPQVQL